MFHFSTDRLAGLDNVILKITAPPKVPTLIPNHDRKLGKPHQGARPPLADMTPSNNLPARPPSPTSCMLSHIPGEIPIPNILAFRPLPPLPSASTLQLPSFLDFSSHDSLADSHPHCSITPLPAPALFRVSSSPVLSSRRAAIRKTKNNKVFEGPQWIPAFHHPNSPYVPWPSPARQRILPPPSPLSPPPLSLSSPRIRSGAVAPEPWASSTFSQAHDRSRKERLSNSWRSFKHSIKQGVKAVISRFGKSTKSLRTPCISQDAYDGTDTAIVQPPVSCNAMQTMDGNPHGSLASFASSDSRTLATWLAERRAHASRAGDDIPMEMSVEEYELMGSWLDLRHCDGGWLCGIQDCGVHTAGGSPCVGDEYPSVLGTAMPFHGASLSSVRPSTLPFPAGPFSAPPRFYSLPRLPCQSFDTCSEPTTLKKGERYRELSMPGGWTFN